MPRNGPEKCWYPSASRAECAVLSGRRAGAGSAAAVDRVVNRVGDGKGAAYIITCGTNMLGAKLALFLPFHHHPPPAPAPPPHSLFSNSLRKMGCVQSTGIDDEAKAREWRSLCPQLVLTHPQATTKSRASSSATA